VRRRLKKRRKRSSGKKRNDDDISRRIREREDCALSTLPFFRELQTVRGEIVKLLPGESLLKTIAKLYLRLIVNPILV